MKHPEFFKHGKQFIKSMQELTRRYQKAMELGISKVRYENQEGMSCLLCNPIGVKTCQSSIRGSLYRGTFAERHDKACAKLGCPWIVILGMTCDDDSNALTGGSIYQSDDPIAMQARVDQLQEWIGIYQDHLKSRKK